VTATLRVVATGAVNDDDDSNAPAAIANESAFIETIIAGHWQRAAAQARAVVGIRTRGILDPMMNRLFALVVALAVVSAPVALEVCQLTCESKGMQPSMPHGEQDHVAHHHAPTEHAACHEHGGTTHQLFPVNGLCDHSTASTPSLVAARNNDTAVSLLATVPSIDSFGLVARGDRISVRESARSQPLARPLAIPLRV
jgi:hypothetical protein